jgi:hypothetical protein
VYACPRARRGVIKKKGVQQGALLSGPQRPSALIIG